ncbi:MAG: hypothetical protein AUF65_01655 [Chloroflexi bacterium 13_1_20CM_50_12]|nr:MAG: hypothetical protein AUF65_01655 [Chloroflexi bacterium 13_1_20CM_50_12]
MNLKNIRSEDLVVYQEQRSRDITFPQYNAGQALSGNELEAFTAGRDDIADIDAELASRGLKSVVGDNGLELVPLSEEEED